MIDSRQYPPTEPPVAEPIHEPPSPKKSLPWVKIALVLIAVGAVLVGIAWATGTQGASIILLDGRLQLIAAADINNEVLHLEIPNSERITYIAINTTTANVVVEYAQPGVLPGVTLRNIGYYAIQESDHDFALFINAEGNERGGVNLFQMGYVNRRQEVRVQIHPEQAEFLRISTTTGNIRVNGINVTISFFAGSTSGNIRIYNVNSEKAFATNTASGNITLNNVRAESLFNASSTSGNVRGEDLYAPQHANIRTTSGNINMSRFSWRGMDATTVSGNINFSDVYIHTSDSGHVTAFRTTSGNVNLDIQNSRTRIGYRLTSAFGNVRVDGQRRGSGEATGRGGPPITVTTTSGNIRLNFDS